MPKRTCRCLAAMALCGLLLTFCGCSDEDFSSSTTDSFGSSAPEESSQVLVSGYETFSSQQSEAEESSHEEAQESQLQQDPAPSSASASEAESSSAAGSSQPAEEASQSAAEPSQSGAEEQQPSTPKPQESAGTYTVLTPVASGTVVYSGGGAQIDASNTSEGYVMIKYNGGVSKIRVQITRDGGSTYTYALNNSGSYEVFPLSQGSGGYSINVYENVSGNQYALALGQYISVSLRNSFLPFLYPNQYVNFYSGSQTVAKGARLASTATSDLEVVENIYNYVIHNISYDFNKAANVSFGYLPNVDSILNSGMGICFDYAAVMATMLRTQNIPTKLVVGYAGNIYHAWISTYITDVGWVNGIIYFDGQSWKRMDPTFASSGNESGDIMSYIGNGSNYNAMYVY